MLNEIPLYKFTIGIDIGTKTINCVTNGFLNEY